MAGFPESRHILWLSAAVVTAAHAAVLFAWPPNTTTLGVLMDEESTGVEVELVAFADQNNEETAAPAENPPAPEPAPFPEPTPPPEEQTPLEEQTEILPKAEASPTPARSRPTPALSKPKKSTAAPAVKPSTSANGMPNVSASQAAFSKRPALIYPSESRQAREEGTVILRITVDARGRPTDVVVIKPSGHPRLDRAAIEGAWRCRIRNAKAGMILDVPLRFDLDE